MQKLIIKLREKKWEHWSTSTGQGDGSFQHSTMYMSTPVNECQVNFLVPGVKKLLFSFRRPEVLAALAAVSVVSVVFLTFSLPSLPVFLTRERALSGAVPDNVARVVGCPEALRGVRFRPGTNRSDVSVVGGRDLTYGKLLERWTAALSDAEEHQRISRCLPEGSNMVFFAIDGTLCSLNY